MSTDDSPGKKKKLKALNPSVGVQLLLWLDMWFRLLIWSAALTATLLVMTRMQSMRAPSWQTPWTFGVAWDFARSLTQFILLFNIVYVLLLVVVRVVVPRPSRGIYKLRGVPNINLLYAGLSGILTKARYHAPFPAILVQQLGNVQPFRWLLGRGFGPRTETSFFLDPTLMDPYAVTIGKNVNIGFGTTITAHIQEFDYIMVDPVVIEDNVMIGAHSAITCGVHIKRGAYLEPFSVVKPGEVIGEGELWAGRPATKGYYRFTPSGGDGEGRMEHAGTTPRETGQ